MTQGHIELMELLGYDMTAEREELNQQTIEQIMEILGF